MSRSSEECPSAEDETNLSSSCSSPCLLDEKDVKPTQLSQTKPIQGYWRLLIEEKIMLRNEMFCISSVMYITTINGINVGLPLLFF